MPPGAFAGELNRLIKGSSAFLVVVTASSHESNFVLGEVLRAHNERKKIIPIIVDHAPKVAKTVVSMLSRLERK